MEGKIHIFILLFSIWTMNVDAQLFEFFQGLQLGQNQGFTLAPINEYTRKPSRPTSRKHKQASTTASYGSRETSRPRTKKKQTTEASIFNYFTTEKPIRKTIKNTNNKRVVQENNSQNSWSIPNLNTFEYQTAKPNAYNKVTNKVTNKDDFRNDALTFTTQNPFFNRPGVKPANVDVNRPPITNKPYVKPVTHKPSHLNDRPVYNNQDRPHRPDFNTDYVPNRPDYINDRPSFTTERPSNNRPIYTPVSPGNNNDRPIYTPDRPINNNYDRPINNNDRPNNNNNKPSNNNDRPIYTPDRPINNNYDRPINNNDRPNNNNNKPSNNNDRPSNHNDRPSFNTDYNRPGSVKPIEGDGIAFVDTSDGPPLTKGIDEDSMSYAERQRHLEIAEQMCTKYKSMLMTQLQAIPLVPSPQPVKVNVSQCTPVKIPLVVGGKIVSIKEFPHMALVGWNAIQGGYSWKCGGSLLSDRFVLTAAHCAYQERDDTVVTGTPRVVQLGSSYLSDPQATVVKISAVIRHPKYKLPKSYYDLALLKLERAVRFSDTIRPACLGTPPPTGQKIIATGWGKTQLGGDQSLELRSVSLPIWDVAECSRALGSSRKLPRGVDAGSQACAGDARGGRDTCQGDSGGPAQIQDGCLWRVTAVTSLGRSCGAPDTPGLYAIVKIPFIAAHVFEGAKLDTRTTTSRYNKDPQQIYYDYNRNNGKETSNNNNGYNYNRQDSYNNERTPTVNTYNDNNNNRRNYNDNTNYNNRDNRRTSESANVGFSNVGYNNNNNDQYNNRNYNNNNKKQDSSYNINPYHQDESDRYLWFT